MSDGFGATELVNGVEALSVDAKTNGDQKENENPEPKTPEKTLQDATNKSPVSSKSFSEQFKAFSKFGDTKSDGKHLSLSQSDKWMKQAKVIDGKTITTTDTGIHFKKLKSLKVTESEYNKFLEDLAKTRKVDVEEIKRKMVTCGAPGLSTNAACSKTLSTVERLTDPSKYTGSHKLRFDADGKGMGIAGRKDIHDNSGYVTGYQNKNTYDKKHTLN